MDLRRVALKLAHANVIIALGPVSMVYLSSSLLDVSLPMIAYLPPFLVAYFVYTFNRLTDLKEDAINNPERFRYVSEKAGFLGVSAVTSLLVASAVSFYLSPKAALVILIPALSVVLYSAKILPKRLKEIFVVKNLVVAGAWAMIPFYIAALASVDVVSATIVSAFIFLRIFVGVVMFDVRDIAGDAATGIETIPVRFGTDKALEIVNALNLTSFLVLTSAAILDKVTPVVAFAAAFVAFLMGVVYIRAVRNGVDLRFLCDVVVDSEYVLLSLPAVVYSIFDTYIYIWQI